MKRLVLFLVVPVLVALATPAAAGPFATSEGFSGSCAITGVSTFDAPLSLVPAVRAHWFDGAGTCTGTLNGRAVQNVPVRHEVSADFGVNSCPANVSVDQPGVFTFELPDAPDVRVAFTQTTTGAGTTLPLLFRGASGGIGVGTISFSLTPEIIEACQNGTLLSAPVRVTVQTLTTLKG